MNLNHINHVKTILSSKDKKPQADSSIAKFDLMREYNIYLLKK